MPSPISDGKAERGMFSSSSIVSANSEAATPPTPPAAVTAIHSRMRRLYTHTLAHDCHTLSCVGSDPGGRLNLRLEASALPASLQLESGEGRIVRSYANVLVRGRRL